MAITIKDIASYLDISISTVSKALNDYPDISPETRQAVLEAVQHLDYYPSGAARSLRSKRTNQIGFFVFTPYEISEQVSEYYFEILRGASLVVEKNDFDLLLSMNSSKQYERFLRIVRSRICDGFVLMGPNPVTEAIDFLIHNKIPFIVVSQPVENPLCSYIMPDNFQGSRMAVRHLIELGHKRIGFINRGQSSDRLKGYLAAHQEFQFPVDPDLIKNVNYSPSEGGGLALELMRLPKPPTAIFTYTDSIALSAMSALQSNGFQIPSHVAVIGFDDIRSSANANPPLSSIRQPLFEMGRQAAISLIDRIQNPGLPPIREIMPVELIIRQSTSLN